MSKHIDFIGNYFEHLGPYDCFFNALVYWMEYHNICTNELYTFNLDISYHSPTGIFSGSAEPHIFFMFLREFFHIETNVYYLQELNEIPLNELFILESNSYFFPNELDYYQKAAHTKYTRHLSSCLFVGCARSPRSHSLLCSRGFTPLPSRFILKSIGYILFL
ncbi:hypothetical protein [Photorhabdus laumondii]|uniref:hypothetical protein n=1 Tax=Photorhabdus laumondii TaxID=2218628 RepID=UPI0011BEF5CE|nr:hypothetical protein [Photorhabdus laumondii]